jgi:hypothetical protein
VGVPASQSALSDPLPLPYQDASNSAEFAVPKASQSTSGFPPFGSDDFWLSFKDYLQKNSKSKQAVKTRLNYARRYYHVLQTGNASELLSLTFDQRTGVMRSMAALAKFSGQYSRWKQIKEAHGLKWNEDSDGGVSLFLSISMDKENLPAMIEWLKTAVSKLPTKYACVLIYDTLTGLRASEACYSIQLLQEGAEIYLNERDQTLEHYRYPSHFIRRTKRCYVSIVNDELLSIAGRADCASGYSGLRSAIKRRELPMNMNFARKVFATWFKSKGVATETVDLLQGRIGKGVFVKHYWRPDFELERAKIRGLLPSLLNEIN